MCVCGGGLIWQYNNITPIYIIIFICLNTTRSSTEQYIVYERKFSWKLKKTIIISPEFMIVVIQVYIRVIFREQDKCQNETPSKPQVDSEINLSIRTSCAD